MRDRVLPYGHGVSFFNPACFTLRCFALSSGEICGEALEACRRGQKFHWQAWQSFADGFLLEWSFPFAILPLLFPEFWELGKWDEMR